MLTKVIALLSLDRNTIASSRMKDFTMWVLRNIEMAEKIHRETRLRHVKLQLPFKVKTFQMEFDVNARNEKEETLMIGVVRYLDNAKHQVHLLKVLNHLNVNVNLVDRQKRSALMFAIFERKSEVAHYLINEDRNGNTALMYAACYGNKRILADITKRLLATGNLEAFSERNCMGNTAARLAKLNGHKKCERLLEKQHIRCMHKMHRQLHLVHAAAGARGWSERPWNQYTTVYKAVLTWRSRTQEAIVRSRSLNELQLEIEVERQHFYQIINSRRSESAAGRIWMYEVESFHVKNVENRINCMPEMTDHGAEPLRRFGHALTVPQVTRNYLLVDGVAQGGVRNPIKRTIKSIGLPKIN